MTTISVMGYNIITTTQRTTKQHVVIGPLFSKVRYAVRHDDSNKEGGQLSK